MNINQRRVKRRWKFGPLEFVSDSVGTGTIDRWIIHWRGLGAIRLHRINKSDERDYHDHRFDFKSLILWRGYREYTPSGVHEFRPGSIVRRKAQDLHRLELLSGPCWTVQVSGPQRRDWGFQTKDGWIPSELYDFYKKYGKEAVDRYFQLTLRKKRITLPS